MLLFTQNSDGKHGSLYADVDQLLDIIQPVQRLNVRINTHEVPSRCAVLCFCLFLVQVFHAELFQRKRFASDMREVFMIYLKETKKW